MLVKIKKLQELPNALHPNNIEEGFEKTFENVKDEWFKQPTVGERFYPDPNSNWSTSGVREILSENTFKTYSSIYEWEVIPAKYKTEIDNLLKELFRESNTTDEDWNNWLKTFFKTGNLSFDKMSNDLEIGVSNGHSVEFQLSLVKDLFIMMVNMIYGR